MYDIYQKFETTTLKNGLTVYCLHWPERAGVHFDFLIHSGARHDPIGKEGTAHFMEHLVSANAMVPFDDLQRFFEHNAGQQPGLGTTHPNGTWYSFLSSIEPSLLAQSLTYYGHMLLQASLEKDVEREREVIIGEFNRKFPMKINYDIHYRKCKAVFSNTFLDRSVTGLGTRETIRALQQSDLQKFYDTHYTPANMSVIVIGELTLTQAVAALENSPFGEYKPGVRSAKPDIITTPPPPTETEYRFHEGEHYKDRSSATFGTTAQLPGAIPPRIPDIVEDMVGKQLFKVIRLEHMWAYSVGCGIQSLGDFYEFSASCSALDTDAVEKISDTVTNCIESVRHQSDVFEEVKHKLVTSMRFSDPNMRSVCKAVRDDILLHNRIFTLTEELHNVQAIQMNDIFPVIDSLAANRRWTMIGYP